jgi:hypothetical protein
MYRLAMRPILASLLVLFMMSDAGVVSAKSTPPIWGVYGDVRYIKEADDLVGIQIELIDGETPSVIFTICEGECRGGKAWPLVITGDELRFRVQDSLIAVGETAPGPPTEYVGKWSGTKIVLKSADFPDEVSTLKKARKPRPFETALLGCHRERC